MRRLEEGTEEEPDADMTRPKSEGRPNNCTHAARHYDSVCTVPPPSILLNLHPLLSRHISTPMTPLSLFCFLFFFLLLCFKFFWLPMLSQKLLVIGTGSCTLLAFLSSPISVQSIHYEDDGNGTIYTQSNGVFGVELDIFQIGKVILKKTVFG